MRDKAILKKRAPLDMTSYRENHDMFVDDDSASSDTRGKQQDYVGREEEIDIDIDFEEDVNLMEDIDEQKEASSSAIPAPYKFSRPRAGGGSRLTVSGAAPIQRKTTTGQSPSLNHHAATASMPQTEADEKMVALVTRTVFNLLGERNPVPTYNKKQTVSKMVCQPSDRARPPERTILAVSLRKQ